MLARFLAFSCLVACQPQARVATDPPAEPLFIETKAEPPPDAATPAPIASPVPSDRCAIEVVAMPPGTVYLDGKAVGTTPLLDLLAEPGVHIVIVRDDTNTTRRSMNVKCEAGMRHRLHVSLKN